MAKHPSAPIPAQSGERRIGVSVKTLASLFARKSIAKILAKAPFRGHDGRTQSGTSFTVQRILSFVTAIPTLVCEICNAESAMEEPQFMSNHPNPEKKKSSQSSEEIQVRPIPKQTAGAVTGAAIGSVAGPIGAVVGGVVGAVAGSAAGRRPIRKAARRVTTASKDALRRHTRKKSRPASRKTGARSRGKTAKTRSKQASTAQSRKRTARGSRARHQRRSSRKKKH